MRRIVLAASLCGIVAGLGCKHIGGKCDCYQEASNGEITAGSNQPYSVVAPPITSGAVPEKLGSPDKAK